MNISGTTNYRQNIMFTSAVQSRIYLRKYQLRPYIEQGFSYQKIAEIFNTTVEAIEYAVKAMDLTPEKIEKLKDSEKKIIEIKQRHGSIQEMMDSTGLSNSRVKFMLRYLFPKGTSSFRNEKIINMINEGSSIEEISRVLNISEKIIKSVLGYSSTAKSLVRRNNQKEEFCLKILYLKANGYSIKEIAEKLNRSEATIKGYLKYCEKQIDLNV